MSTVRSKVLIGAFALCFAAMCGLLVGCSGNNSDSKSESNDASINVTSREDGSGTRGAFIELLALKKRTIAAKRSTRPLLLPQSLTLLPL